ncbi:hypothetical protein ACSFA3_06940 [Variovorax sp. RHLX14]|uniref:hypothetical protein n=1 Tax=Variovorax sp. RHLX14 TaxID=1259731 RepID=UPI003F456829
MLAKIISIFLKTVSLLIFSSHVLAQNSEGLSSKTSYAQSALNADSITLPNSYNGHDCQSIATALQSQQPSRSEFETEKDYLQRVDVIASSRLYGNIKTIDPIAFKSDLNPNGFRYDADQNLATINLDLSRRHLEQQQHQNINYKAEEISVISSSVKEVLRSVGFGNLVSTGNFQKEVCAAIFINLKNESSDKRYRATFEATPVDAQRLKNNGGILFFGALAPPYLMRYSNLIRPTNENPDRFETTGDGVVMRLDQIWIFDRVTGKV